MFTHTHRRHILKLYHLKGEYLVTVAKPKLGKSVNLFYALQTFQRTFTYSITMCRIYSYNIWYCFHSTRMCFSNTLSVARSVPFCWLQHRQIFLFRNTHTQTHKHTHYVFKRVFLLLKAFSYHISLVHKLLSLKCVILMSLAWTDSQPHPVWLVREPNLPFQQCPSLP